jgi:hypothetical protein
MKLYTEEQAIRAIKFGYCDVPDVTPEEYVDSLTPIELPSDEDIEKYADYEQNFIDGAKWMREQILNQNK